MFHLSFSTVLMTMLMSTLMLTVIAACFRNEKLMSGIGRKWLAAFCIVILLRMLLPLELPFTRTIPYPELLSGVMTFFLHPFGTVFGIKLRLWTVFCAIWLIVTIILWVRYFQKHRCLRHYAMMYGRDITNEEPYASMLRELCSEKQRQRIRIMSVYGTDSPLILGLRRPIILLPADAEVSDDDTYFAIKHELYHYAHHDLWIMAITRCLTIVYWWNPLCRQLNNRIDTLMEMRIDAAIMQRNPDDALKYVSSLHHHLVSADNRSKKNDPFIALRFGKRSSLSQRIHMMSNLGQKRNLPLCIGMLILMVGIYVGSYLVILEPASYGFCDSKYQLPSRDNIYALINDDGCYDIYTSHGNYLETADTLKYYQGITLYISEENIHEKNQ